MNILERVKAKTPAAWRFVTYVSSSLKAACLLVLGMNLATPLPSDLTTAAGWVLGVCVLITAFAESQVKKPEEPKV